MEFKVGDLVKFVKLSATGASVEIPLNSVGVVVKSTRSTKYMIEVKFFDGEVEVFMPIELEKVTNDEVQSG